MKDYMILLFLLVSIIKLIAGDEMQINYYYDQYCTEYMTQLNVGDGTLGCFNYNIPGAGSFNIANCYTDGFCMAQFFTDYSCYGNFETVEANGYTQQAYQGNCASTGYLINEPVSISVGSNLY